MPRVPTPCRVVIYHHNGDGLTPNEPHDIPAMILEVSGGPISPPGGEATDLQTAEGTADSIASEPYLCLLELFRLRSKEWRRDVPEGDGPGQWSWPTIEPAGAEIPQYVKDYVDERIEQGILEGLASLGLIALNEENEESQT